jgi:hypothetical protein
LFPLCFHSVSTFSGCQVGSGYKEETKWKHVASSRKAIWFKQKGISMTGKPFQSKLIPYKNEIAVLRSERPPASYARIATVLKERHGLSIQRAAIAKFVKVRSGGRKVYFIRKDIAAGRAMSPQHATQAQQAAASGQPANLSPKQDRPKPVFEFQYSERYNLKRLPPEEAAAIRKKLEAEGH